MVRAVEVVPGGCLRWVDTGRHGRTRVFLHGLGSCSAPYFAATASRLAGRSLMPDFLGHGVSDRPAAFAGNVEAHAATIAALLDHLAMTEVELVGHSLGGSVAIVLAATRPDLVATLVTVEPNLSPRTPRRGAAGSAGIAAYDEDEFVAAGFEAVIVDAGPTWAATMRLADPRLLHRSATSLVDVELRPAVRTLGVPHRMIVGGDPDEDDDRLAADGFDVVRIPGAGHNVMLDAPDEFLAALSR